MEDSEFCCKPRSRKEAAGTGGRLLQFEVGETRRRGRRGQARALYASRGPAWCPPGAKSQDQGERSNRSLMELTDCKARRCVHTAAWPPGTDGISHSAERRGQPGRNQLTSTPPLKTVSPSRGPSRQVRLRSRVSARSAEPVGSTAQSRGSMWKGHHHQPGRERAHDHVLPTLGDGHQKLMPKDVIFLFPIVLGQKGAF